MSNDIHNKKPSSSPAPELFKGGNGSSIENAVIVNDDYCRDIVSLEYEFINRIARQRMLNWKLDIQSLLSNDDRMYDCLAVVWSNGEKEEFYFDITSTWG